MPGDEAVSWQVVFAPAGTPRPVVDRLHEEIRKVLALPDVRERMARLGAEPSPTTPAQVGALIQSELKKYAAVVRASGAKVD